MSARKLYTGILLRGIPLPIGFEKTQAGKAWSENG